MEREAAIIPHMMTPAEFVIPQEFDGVRLDAALALVLPESGLRARRRLWENGAVLVNGTARKPGWLVRAGDMVRIQSAAAVQPGQVWEDAANPGAIRNPGAVQEGMAAPGQAREGRAHPEHVTATPLFSILGLGNGFVAFDKPAGLHTAHIAGSGAPSLEGLLPQSWECLWRAFHVSPDRNGLPLSVALPPPPHLLTRLDGETSGIVLGLVPGIVPVERGDKGARVETGNTGSGIIVTRPESENVDEGLAVFRKWERQGKACKEYFALVRGELSGVLYLRERLDTANRRVTKVLAEKERDGTRHTHVEPLEVCRADALLEKGMLLAAAPACVFTLVRVSIMRGARHQIRAHLAHAGFPILGDNVYDLAFGKEGVQLALAAPRMYLHHARLRLPGFSAQSPPGWDIGEYLVGP